MPEIPMEEHSQNSSFREKLIEHLFIGELLKISWKNKDFSFEVAKPEVDNSGYDLIIESNNILRHIQLESAFIGSTTASQNINISLSKKPSGCVIWIYFNQDNLELGPFLFFGNKPGRPLPCLESYKTAKHTRANSTGHKAERKNIKTVSKNKFTTLSTVEEVYKILFFNEQ